MSPTPRSTASNRRQFLRLVGAASAGAVAFSGGAAATIADATINAGAGYVDALAAAQRAEEGDLATFDEVELAGEQ